MIDLKLRKTIEVTAQKFWNVEIQKSFFDEVAQGKEIGHRLADIVDDKTTGLLAVEYTAMYQRDRSGLKVPRSMGDIWLKSSDVFHPVNVKTSVTGNNGQPNMVSLKKLLAALLAYQIDSYYLLMVKIQLNEGGRTAKIHFVDMLDHLDYVTFDSGPGQIMLKAKSFFEARETEVVPEDQPLKVKVERLVDLLEDGERRLIKNRKRVLKLFREMADAYDTEKHIVSTQTQVSLNIQ